MCMISIAGNTTNLDGGQMNLALKPLRSQSLKEIFISRFEEMILSGQLGIGQRLPPERELAKQLKVSRPVVHEGLLELSARGLVKIKPRHGAFVCDYRRDGSLSVLSSLLNYAQGALEAGLLAGLLDLRRLVETETSSLAARNRSAEDLAKFGDLLGRESRADARDVARVSDLDFEFHHQVCLASGNPIYPMLIKSFEPAYKNLTRQFFAVDGTAKLVFGFHSDLVRAIEAKDTARAGAVMSELLDHGRRVLYGEV